MLSLSEKGCLIFRSPALDMAEIGRQDRQATVWILTGPIPAYERIGRKCVPHILQTWPVVVCHATQDRTVRSVRTIIMEFAMER